MANESMIAACPKCAARYRLARARLRSGGVRLRCSRCEAVFRVTPPASVSAPAEAPAPRSSPEVSNAEVALPALREMASAAPKPVAPPPEPVAPLPKPVAPPPEVVAPPPEVVAPRPEVSAPSPLPEAALGSREPDVPAQAPAASALPRTASVLPQQASVLPPTAAESDKLAGTPAPSPDVSGQPRSEAERANLVLLADSEVEAGKGLASTLASWGLEPLLVHDGVEAILTIQRALPRLVILDAALPKMFGFQVCEFMKRNESLRSIHVVLIGAIHHRDRYRRAPSEIYGADAYAERPDLPEALRPILSRFGFPVGAPADPVRTVEPPLRAPLP